MSLVTVNGTRPNNFRGENKYIKSYVLFLVQSTENKLFPHEISRRHLSVIIIAAWVSNL